MTNLAANPTRNAKINAIQFLRAYAAISVMIGHSIKEWAEVYSRPEPFDVSPLLYGVDIFFVISGFIMYHTSRDLFGTPGGPRTFFHRRLIRIVPLYWLFTTAMVGALLFMGDFVNSTEFDLWGVVSSYLFIPFARPDGRIAPVLSLGWTLNYEMFFYALFAGALMFRRGIGLVVLIGALLCFVLFGALAQPQWAPLKFWTSSVILEFAAGVLLAVLWERVRFQSLIVVALLVGGGFLLLFGQVFGSAETAPRFLTGGVPALLIVAGALATPPALDQAIPRLFTLLGDSSYALYLSHRFVLRAATIVLGGLALGDPGGLVAYTGAVTVVALLVSIAVFLFVERPTLALLRPRTLRLA